VPGNVPGVGLHLSQNAEADKVISANPFALLMGMLLDQQVMIEVAFAAPAELQRRLGKRLSPALVASMDPDELAAVFVQRPALHRYPGSMARRVHGTSRVLVEEYGGRADNVWKGVSSGKELVGRLEALPGFGDQKARIFAALLGKQLGVQPDGWREASTPYGEQGCFRSVADIVDTETLTRVRAFKQDLKAATKASAQGATAGSATRATRATRAKARTR